MKDITYDSGKRKQREQKPCLYQTRLFHYWVKGGKGDEKVFADLKYSAWHNEQLKKWLQKAGITKEITFHCFRHTYATLQLSLGTDLYTVSKMLGHREIKTTQVYA